MIKVIRLQEYSPEVASALRHLMTELSRSGQDKGEIPEHWFGEIISSPWHDLLLAIETPEQSSENADNIDAITDEINPALRLSDSTAILGMAALSIIMGAGVRKNAYLEDFVVTTAARGKGISTLLWEEMLLWSKEKGAHRLEFTCGQGRDAAQAFYHKHGAKIYDTNFFRYEIGE